MFQRTPHQLALADTAPQAARKEQAFLLKELHGGQRRTGAFERLEERVQRSLYLLVGVQHHTVSCVADRKFDSRRAGVMGLGGEGLTIGSTTPTL